MQHSQVVVVSVTAMPHELNGLVALDAARADDRFVSLV